MIYIVFYLIFINILSFLLFGADKSNARKKRWRVPERTLFFLVLLGGGIGAETGMLCFRHKTKHARFLIGIPFIILLQLTAALYIYSLI